MSAELAFTLATAMLAASMWLPYIVGVNSTQFEGQAESFVRPPDQRAMAPWIHRAHRAHLNLIEQFVPFAAVVLIGVAAGASSPWLGWLAGAFFVLRCAHAVGMVSGWTRFPLRPIIFTACYVIVLAYAAIVWAVAA